jgi:hypothetical protein
MRQHRESRCTTDSVDYRTIVNRQNFAPHPLFKTPQISKILHFLSKSGVTEIFSCSAASVDSETIPDIAPNCRFRVAEIFLVERMSRKN